MFQTKIYHDPKWIVPMLTDTDSYKLSMLQFILHRHSGATTKWRFKCRDENLDLIPFKKDIEEQIQHLCSLKFTVEELEYLSKIRWMKQDFIDFLEDFTLKNRYIHVEEKNGKLDIYAEGAWLQVELFEIYVLKIVMGVINRYFYPQQDLTKARAFLNQKIQAVQNFIVEGNKLTFVDFSTRRAFSGVWQEEMISTLARAFPKEVFPGTSNVMLAMKYNLAPIGTMAHSLFQCGQNLGVKLVDSQKFILQEWCNEYRGDLGIALSDTLGIDKFLKDFDLYFAKLYSGVRNDSGDPFDWGEKVIAHYEKLGIDPRTKSLVFSDCIDFQKAFELIKRFGNRSNISFGIGTNLGNDCGYPVYQMVMKVVECNGKPTAKISDSAGKCMCEDKEFINYLKKVIEDDLRT